MEPKTKDLRPIIEDLGSRTKDLGPKIKDLGSKIKSLGPTIKVWDLELSQTKDGS